MKKIISFLFNSKGERKVQTELYPDPVSSRTADDLPARARGFLKNNIDACTGCGECVRACPTSCIQLVNGPEVRRKFEVKEFSIDFSNCIFCGECVAVCEPQSLKQEKIHVKPEVDPSLFFKRQRPEKREG